ncbi:hypothetical protein K466DRAFT_490220 [Polyporus arcularius HHB13444]|uniref:Uncharacterized protein n=1 Tax=Polyporus arcularius HHB13444 TaxID=1314778 RepID=A0A5C3PG04_9APHY|nr:hypothetical protein K466DRAFT_490220 [Polyporus arcularius HHB13444]
MDDLEVDVDVESVSGSEDENESEYHDALSPSPGRKGKGRAIPSPMTPRRTPASEEMPKAKRSGMNRWAELDLSIIVALVSPIGNWLTGGDHIKNVFLIILLIFYLHQIVEIPWQLYLAARPRKSGRRVPPHHADEDEKIAYLTAVAHSELRRSELIYMGLAIVSPFIGAAFLGYVLSALGDGAALSWFSTTLFVLATGIRPWSHLINRLQERTQELHTALHYPDEDSLASRYEENDRTLHAALKRIESLEREVDHLQEHVKRVEQLREVCDDLSDFLGDVERTVKRNERKADAVRTAQSVRITTVEQALVALDERRKKDIAAFEAAGIRLPDRDTLFKQARLAVASASVKILSIPRTILMLGLEDPDHPSEGNEFRVNPRSNGHAHGNGTSLHPTLRSPDREKHFAHIVPTLETIPEAEDSDSEDTFVDRDGPTSPSLKSKSRSRSGSGGARARKAPRVGQKTFDIVQSVVLWPYRFSLRVILAVFPPAHSILPRV